MAAIYRPTVVIGLGGTGKGIILALKKMIAENSKHGMADYPFLHVLSIDTDVSVGDAKSSIRTIKESELTLNPNKEIYNLRVDFVTPPNLNEYPIGKWFPSSQKHYLTAADIAKGASQRKTTGRFSFAWNASDLMDRLRNILANPVDINTARDLGLGSNIAQETNVFICGSLCGGTGSGTFLDTAYLVRHIAKVLGRNDIKIYGIFALSTMFEGMQGDVQIKPNCYASLVELDHFMNKINYGNPNRQFQPAYKNFSERYDDSSMYPPFDFPFLFDKTNREGFSFNSPTAFNEMAARFIFLLTGHEVSNNWQSMDSNVYSNLASSYKNILLKPVEYRSMGVYSIIFPKRTVIQLCSYRLAREYLSAILDDMDSPEEINRMSTRLLDDLKMNPAVEDIFEEAFDIYRGTEGIEPFSSYIQRNRDDFDFESVDKKELVKSLREWKKAMDANVQEFKLLNSTKPRDVRAGFLSQLDKKLSQLLELKYFKDGSNLGPDNEPRSIKGSIVRANKILFKTLETLRDASEKYRRIEEENNMLAQSAKSNAATLEDDLEELVRSLLPNKKKMEAKVDEVLDTYAEELNARRRALISIWVRQLLEGILENNIPKYPGLIAELEQRESSTKKGLLTMQTLKAEVEQSIKDNSLGEKNPLSDVLFKSEIDVDGNYDKLIQERGEDVVLAEMSDHCKNAFGSCYEKVADMEQSLVLREILSKGDDFFFDRIEALSIEDKIISDPDSLARLKNGFYTKAAAEFIGLDGGEMSRENLSRDKFKFFAITIPNNYTSCPCKDLKGALGTIAGKRICPMDADPEQYKNKPCPKYGKCLKQILLNLGEEHIAIIPTSENSEVNIITSIAGFPLHAVTTAIHNCRTSYLDARKKEEDERKKNHLEEEILHMFGTIKLDDIMEESVDPRAKYDELREDLMYALCATRLVVDKLNVSYITSRDLELGRRDNPSVQLGRNMDEIYTRFESTKEEDVKIFATLKNEMDIVRKSVAESENVKARFIARVKETHEALAKSLPSGMNDLDLQMIEKIGRDWGLELSPAKSGQTILGF